MCCRISVCLCAIAIMTVIGGSDLRAQNKNPSAAKATEAEYDQLAGLKTIAGSLVFADPGGKTVTVRVNIPRIERNPNYRPPRVAVTRGSSRGYLNRGQSYNPQQHIASMMSRYQQIMRTRDPVQREQQLRQLAFQMQQMEAQALMQFPMQVARMEMQQMQQMARVMQQFSRSTGGSQPYKIVNTPKDFDLDLQDNVSVRRMFLPVEFDDMGNQKKYSKAELAELRGTDSTKPGYTAKLDELQGNQEVTLYLAPARKAAAPSSHPTVRMIVLMRDSSALAGQK